MNYLSPNSQLAKPPIPELEIDMESDRKLGVITANAKLAITQRGFDQRYEQGIESFWQQNGALEVDEELGSKVAALMVEGGRRALVKMLLSGGVYSAALYGAALAIGLSPAQSCIVLPPAVVGAVVVSKRG